jgi:hypothetical protein
MGKDSSTCLGCSKKFTKSDTSVQCAVCGLWTHTTCADITKEVFDLLDKQRQLTGKQFWACRPCSTYAAGMNHRLRQIDDEIKDLKLNTAVNTEAIQNLEKKVEEVADIAKKSEGMSRQEIEDRLKQERDEIRDRKDKELNIIMHGLEECDEPGLTGTERMEQDALTGLQHFADAGVKIQLAEIKFCRRVGPKGEKARPLVMGFYNQAVRGRALKADLTEQGISVGPDLTKRQREEEAEIWREKETKNLNRTAEEKEKNLFWRLVGPKGDRRLVLGPARQPEPAGAAAGAARGQGRGAWRGAVVRGRGRIEQRAAVRGGVGRVGAASRIGAGLGPVLLDSTRTEQEFRPRIGSKRKEPEARSQEEEEEVLDEDMMEPPSKH